MSRSIGDNDNQAATPSLRTQVLHLLAYIGLRALWLIVYPINRVLHFQQWSFNVIGHHAKRLWPLLARRHKPSEVPMSDRLWQAICDLDISPANVFGLENEFTAFPALLVPCSDAMRIWSALRDLSQATGHWPVISRHISILPYEIQTFDCLPHNDPAETLRRAERVDIRQWLADQKRENQQDLAQEESLDAEKKWPDGPDTTIPHFQGDPDWIPWTMGGGDSHSKACRILLPPTPDGLEAAAYLEFGGNNWSPLTEYHIALWRRWDQTYGLELVALEYNQVEFRIKNPPTSKEASRALAREQYFYCTDMLQTYESLHTLAVRLWKTPMWFFWWD